MGYFPELRFPASFSPKKARAWARMVPQIKIRSYVEKKLSLVLSGAKAL